jgi:hypothetical protein
MKVISWIIALLGLWEFGDIVALFVPGFGKIPIFVWNHILVGLVLIVVGVWSARTGKASTVNKLHGGAIAAGLWLIVSAFVLRYPIITAGLWNDIIVGAGAILLGIEAVLISARTTP